VDDRHARPKSELDRLTRERVRPRDEGLGRDDGRDRRDRDHRITHPPGDELVERVLYVRSALEIKRTLAEITDEQGRKNDGVPGDTNRAAPEVPHVRVERLAPRDAEDHRAEDQERVPAMVDEEPDGVTRVDGMEHLGPT
jgi:hypothetical protein